MHVCKVGGAGDGFCLHNRELCGNAKNELCRTVRTLGRTVKPESLVPRAAGDTLLNTVVTSWAAGHSFQRHLCTKSGCSVTPFEPLAPNFTTTSSPDFDRKYRAGPSTQTTYTAAKGCMAFNCGTPATKYAHGSGWVRGASGTNCVVIS